jgi:large repetitive protein
MFVGNGSFIFGRGLIRATVACAALLLSAQVRAQPMLSIADVSIAEGDAGATTMVFPVRLSEPAPAGGVRFDIAASDGTADAGDYMSGLSLTGATIPEGESEYAFEIAVFADEDYEPDETFFVDVANVEGADIVDGRAIGTILNDEFTPQVAGRNRSVVEGDIGDTAAIVEIALQYPSMQEVRVDYATEEGTARPFEDYASASGTLVFAPGETLRTVAIAIHGDTEDERAEYFDLVLSNAVGATLGEAARIYIATDDGGIDAIQPTTLPDGALGERYDQGFHVERYPNAVFEIASGALPPGIALTLSNGRAYAIGTPTATGTYTFAMTARIGPSPEQVVAHRGYTIVIGGHTLTLPPTTLPDAAFDDGYSAALNPATGAQPPYRYAITAGALPPGLTLSENGTIEGSSVGSGAFAFTVTVSDSSAAGPYTASRDYTLQALPPTFTFAPLFSLDGTEGGDYSAQFAVDGRFTEPLVFSLTGGALPAGLQLSPGGEITGIPAESGDFPIDVTLADSTSTVPGVAAASFVLRIAPPQISFGPSTLPAAVAGRPYAQRFEPTDGTSAYLYSLIEGELPPGIDFDGQGLSGTPAALGVYAFTIQASDGPSTYTRRYALRVDAAPPPPPRAVLSVLDAAVVEGDSRFTTLRFEIRSSAPAPAAGIAFDVQTVDGTATTAGADYIPIATQRVTIPPHLASASFEVRITSDRNPEADETFLLRLSNPSGAVIGDGEAVGTIISDDRRPRLILDDDIVYEGGVGYFYAVLDAPAGPEGVSFTLRTIDGTAVASEDYEGFESRRYTIPPGERVAFADQVTLPDTLEEGEETFFIEAIDIIGADPPTSRATVRIVSIAQQQPALSVEDTSVIEGDTGTQPMTFEIRLSEPSAHAVSARYSVGAFFDPVNPRQYGRLLFAPGETSKTVAHPVRGDTVPESSERIHFDLRTAENARIERAYAIGTIIDDDNPIELDYLDPEDGRVGEFYWDSFTPNGGREPYVYAIVAGRLPDGLFFDDHNAEIYGTPTESGDFTFTLQVTDSSPGPVGPFVARADYTLRVKSNLVTLPATPLRDATQGMAYSAVIGPATGGQPPYRYESTQTLPSGLSLASDGTLSGTPTQSGTYYVSVLVTDSSPAPGPHDVWQSHRLVIHPPGLRLLPTQLPSAQVGEVFDVTLAADGTVPPYTYALTAGALPNGLHFDASGRFSGTPTRAGTFDFSITATDSATPSPRSITIDYRVLVFTPLIQLTPSNPSYTAGYDAPYTQTFIAGGGIGPYVYSLSGTLPPGMQFDGNTLSGRSRASGAYPLQVTATDTGADGQGAPFKGSLSFYLTIAASPVVIAPADDVLPLGRELEPYSVTLSASGGTAPYRFETIDLTILPPGISLSEDGVLSGTTTHNGVFPVTVRCTDAAGITSTRRYSLAMRAPILTLEPASLPAGTASVEYPATPVVVAGGVAPYSIMIHGLPDGMRHDTTAGTIGGTPRAAGSFEVSIHATDSSGGGVATIRRTYTLEIAPATLTLLPESLPAAAVGVSYRQAFAVSGGVAPYRFSASTEAVAPGIVFDIAAGELVGVPTQPGTYAFSITAEDSTGGIAASTTRSYTLTVSQPMPAIAKSAPVANDDRATVPSGETIPIPLTGNDTGTIASIRIVTPPANGNVVTAPPPHGGGVLGVFYTATRGYAGPDSFTYVAVGPEGTSAPATVAITVNAFPVAAPKVMRTSPGISVDIDLTTGAIGGPFTGAGAEWLTTGAGELQVVVSGSTYRLRYTPAPGFTGSARAQYRLSNAYYTSQAADIEIEVGPLPQPQSRTVPAQAGQVTTVDVGAGAANGPFTAIALIALSPADAGVATVGRDDSDAAARYVVRFTPDVAFRGTAVVQYTLSNAYGTSLPSSVSFSVDAGPDPTGHPDLRGLIDAQQRGAQRFADAQIGNFRQRLERLHGGREGRNGFSNGLSFAAARRCTPRVGAMPDGSPDTCIESGVAGATVADRALIDRAAAGDAPRRDALFGTWIAGTVRSGDRDARHGRAALDFETEGVSAGADRRFGDGYAGLGVGYGRDRTWVGDDDSRSDARATTVAFYGGHAPGKVFFLDGVLGHQSLQFDLRRSAAADTFRGRRDGRQWFAALTAGADLERGRWRLSPYGRWDVAHGTLDGYVEQGGDPAFALRHAAQTLRTRAGNLGLRVDYRRDTRWGLFAPQLRIEYRHDFDARTGATLRYADSPAGPVYRIEPQGFDRDRWEIGLGASFETGDDWRIHVGYRGTLDASGSSAGSDHGLSLDLQHEF